VTDADRDTATLHYPGGTAEFPILPSTQGASSLDISQLTRKTGFTTLDNGFVNTASTRSAITYIDGDQGVLRYRGYPIAELAQHSTYLEVAWLLIHGELPSATELAEFDERIRRHTLLHEDLRRFFDALPHTAHPMTVLSSAVSALSTYYEDTLSPRDPEQVEMQTIRLLAKLPVIAAYAHKKTLGQAFLYPDNSLSFVDNFLRLNFGTNAEPYEVNPVLSKALERLLILHEDHEQNASASTVRLVGSTEANMFVSISAGIAALSGPLHGGANEAVMHAFAEIGSADRAEAWLDEALAGRRKIMGFGHRVYKHGDSRVPTMKAALDRLFAEHGAADTAELYDRLEAAMRARKGIEPNLDYPSGPAYDLLGFDVEQFTPLFVAARVAGWTAHVMEQRAANALIRPLSEYVGPAVREVPAGA